nr:hypothetical protein [Rubrivivax sp. A210]
MLVVDDPGVHRLARPQGRLYLAPRDAAATLVGLVAIAVRDDADDEVGRCRQALAFGHRSAGQRAEALHYHRLLLQAQQGVVGDAAVFGEIERRGREEDAQLGHAQGVVLEVCNAGAGHSRPRGETSLQRVQLKRNTLRR